MTIGEWLGGPEIQVPTLQRFLEDFFIKNWKTKLAAFALVSACWLVLASHLSSDFPSGSPIVNTAPPCGEFWAVMVP